MVIRGLGHVEACGQGTVDFDVPFRLGLLEDAFEGLPGTVSQSDAGNDLEQAGPGENAVLLPQAHDDLVQPQPVGQRHFGVGRFEGLDLLDPVMGLFFPGLAAEAPAADLRQEAIERRRAVADRFGRRLVGLGGQGLDERHQFGVLGLPGVAQVLEMEGHFCLSLLCWYRRHTLRRK